MRYNPNVVVGRPQVAYPALMVWTAIIAVCLALTVSPMWTLPIGAQTTPPATTSAKSPVTSTEPARPAVVSYKRYRSPSACVAAVHREEFLHWRANRPDSLSLSARQNWSAPALAAAQSCAQHVVRDSIPWNELLSMTELMFVLGDVQAARSAADQYIRKLPAPKRALAVIKIIEKIVNARPIQLQVAEEYAAQLDSLGKIALGARVVAYTLIGDWMTYRYDLTGMARVTQRGLDAYDALADSSKKEWASEFSKLKYRTALLALEGPGGNTEAQSILAKTATLLEADRPDLANGLRASVRRFAMEGKTAELVTGTWANITPGDTIRPKPGSVSLIVFTSHLCGYYCYPGLGVLRRIVRDRFKNDSTSVTLVMTAHSMFRLQGYPMALAKEIEKAKTQYVTDEKINVGMVFQEPQRSQIPDGRYITEPTVNARRYDLAGQTEGLALGVLVDRDGNIRMVELIVPELEGRWNTALERLGMTN